MLARAEETPVAHLSAVQAPLGASGLRGSRGAANTRHLGVLRDDLACLISSPEPLPALHPGMCMHVQVGVPMYLSVAVSIYVAESAPMRRAAVSVTPVLLKRLYFSVVVDGGVGSQPPAR